MPIHDWTRFEPGDFHHLHQRWIQDIAAALNSDVLPPEYMALAEHVTGRPIPDVVTLHALSEQGDPGGVAVAAAPPTARVIARLERINYAKRADRVVIRHGRGWFLPSSKSCRRETRTVGTPSGRSSRRRSTS